MDFETGSIKLENSSCLSILFVQKRFYISKWIMNEGNSHFMAIFFGFYSFVCTESVQCAWFLFVYLFESVKTVEEWILRLKSFNVRSRWEFLYWGI